MHRGVGVRGEGTRLGGLEAVDPHHLVLAGLDARPPGRVRGDQPGLEVPRLHRRHHPAQLRDLGHLRLGAGHQLGRLGLHHGGAVEQVAVLQQVRLVRQHLLDAQAPLLVPGPGQAQRLVPGRELDGAGPRVSGQGDGQHLQDDPLDVVLRLRLGQAQRVDLHAVAEAAARGVGDPVPLPGDRVPEPGEGPHLAHLLDEADARVHEEGDPPDDLAHPLRRGPAPGQRPGRRSRCPARRRSPGPGWPRPPAGGSCTR